MLFPVGDDGWLDFFGKLYMATTFAAVFCTAVALFASGGIKRYSERINNAQAKKVAEANERAGEANKQAGLANASAGTAHKAAGDANAEAGRANERAATLEKDAADARKVQAELVLASEELRKDNLAAAEKLEEEKRKRIALAVSLLPRNFRDQSGAIVALSRFIGMTAVIEYVDEGESLETAKQINFVLETAKWKVSGGPARHSLRAGIEVTPSREIPSAPPFDELRKRIERNDITRTSAEALSDALTHSGIDAHTVTGPPNTGPLRVLVQVGLKPNPVLDNALQELGPQPSPTPLDGNFLGGNKLDFKPQAPPDKN